MPNRTTDKSSCREFVSSHPLYVSALISYNLCASTFLEQFLDRIGYRLQNIFWDEDFTLDELYCTSR